MAVTPLHILAGYSAIIGDGYWREPKLVQAAERAAPTKVISPETVAMMRTLMAATAEHGTGRLARVAGYPVGGKTGTAEKNTVGGYDVNKNIASFVGAAPIHDPKLVTLVMFDEPNQAYNTGGMIAAPAFAKFNAQALPLLGVVPVVTQPLKLPTMPQHVQAPEGLNAAPLEAKIYPAHYPKSYQEFSAYERAQ